MPCIWLAVGARYTRPTAAAASLCLPSSRLLASRACPSTHSSSRGALSASMAAHQHAAAGLAASAARRMSDSHTSLSLGERHRPGVGGGGRLVVAPRPLLLSDERLVGGSVSAAAAGAEFGREGCRTSARRSLYCRLFYVQQAMVVG